MSASPVQNEPRLPAPVIPSPSLPPLEAARPADRRYLAGCVTGLLLGVALAVPGAYALVRVDGFKTPIGAQTRGAAIRAPSAPAPAHEDVAAAAGAATPSGAATRNDEVLATLLSVGLGALAEKNPTRALELFQAAERVFPRNARVHNDICVALNELQRYAEAVAHCKLAVTLEPELTLAANNLQWAEDQLRKASPPSAETP